jgi:hypothetical protein
MAIAEVGMSGKQLDGANCYVESLLEIAGPFSPIFQPSERDWLPIESYLGLQFSPDYKDLTSRFGFGRFGEIELATPIAPERRRLSIDNLLFYKQMVKRDESKMGIAFFPHPNGLICLGRTGMRVQVCLRPPFKRDPKWIVAICDFDIYHHFEFRIPMSEFIFKLYKREIRSTWLDKFRRYVWRDEDTALFTPFGSSPQRGLSYNCDI